jgi:hypothetical protein
VSVGASTPWVGCTADSGHADLTAPHWPARRRRPAKGIWFLGKKVAKRKAKKRARNYGDAARAAWLGVTICGPMAAEALGLLEQPKRPSRFPAFLAGTVAGAGAMFLAGRNRTA